MIESTAEEFKDFDSRCGRISFRAKHKLSLQFLSIIIWIDSFMT